MIYIEVRGGVVVAAYSNDSDRLVVIDHDQPMGEEITDFCIDHLAAMPNEVAQKLQL